jgi:DNA (cytosine-5)-methyltransferase 1
VDAVTLPLPQTPAATPLAAGRQPVAPPTRLAGARGGDTGHGAPPLLLDLFCGAGGATRGYQEAGFHVTGVDNRPQPRYVGDAFHQADALAFIAEHGHEFDAIHASPPCQDHSAMSRVAGTHGTGWMLAATREALELSGRAWVLENVPGADLPGALMLCGTEFGLRSGRWWLRRHRLFLSNVALLGAGGCHCYRKSVMGVFGDLRANDRRTTAAGKPPKMRASVHRARELLDCPWMDAAELSQAIPPAMTRFVGEQLAAHLEQMRGHREVAA